VTSDDLGDINVYAFHAPSSGDRKPAKAVGQLTWNLIEKHGDREKWVLIGDLNIEPHTLASMFKGTSEEVNCPLKNIEEYIIPPPQETYKGKGVNPKKKKYDYALTNIKNKGAIEVQTDPQYNCSDHHPIILNLNVNRVGLEQPMDIDRQSVDSDGQSEDIDMQSVDSD